MNAEPAACGHAGFRQGFTSMLPLWAGAIPSGIAFGIAARSSGLSDLHAQLMSLLVFSSAAQIAVIGREGLDQPVVLLVLTAIALNAHLPLLGAAVNHGCSPSRRVRPLIAWFLTDGAFGVAASFGRLRLPVLLGAGVSMYLAWNLGTSIGLAGVGVIPEGARAGLDLVIPLTFLAVLMPMVRSRGPVAIALTAAIVGYAGCLVLPAGVAVLVAGFAGALAGDRFQRDA